MEKDFKPTQEELSLLLVLRKHNFVPGHVEDAVSKASADISAIIEAVQRAKKIVYLSSFNYDKQNIDSSTLDSLLRGLRIAINKVETDGVKRSVFNSPLNLSKKIDAPKISIGMSSKEIEALYYAGKLNTCNIDEDAVIITNDDVYAILITSDDCEMAVRLSMPDKRLYFYVNETSLQPEI